MSADDAIAFALDDHRGGRTTEASHAGRYSLVFFGFTHCRTVCPRALDRLEQAFDLLGALASSFQPLYITVDPDRDDAERLRTFLADRPGVLGLTGTPAELEAARRSFRAFARRKEDADDPDGYAMPHTALTYVLDDRGHLLTHLGDALAGEEVAEVLREIVEGTAPATIPDVDQTAGPACPAECPVGCCITRSVPRTRRSRF
jgi:protein SCO1/2